MVAWACVASVCRSKRACVRACVACVRACARACVRACVRACLPACVCETHVHITCSSPACAPVVVAGRRCTDPRRYA
eukprot:1631729-Pleurochrysis_carterae.AAC.3